MQFNTAAINQHAVDVLSRHPRLLGNNSHQHSQLSENFRLNYYYKSLLLVTMLFFIHSFLYTHVFTFLGIVFLVYMCLGEKIFVK